MEKVNEELLEVTYTQLKDFINSEKLSVVIAYTPTCGTCYIAKKMLNIIKVTMTDLDIFQVNLNYNEQMAIEYKILSVPCILILKDNQCLEKIYAVSSIPYLYKKITSYL